MKSIIRAIYDGNLDAADLCAGYSEAFFASQQAYWEYAKMFSAKQEKLNPALAAEFRDVIDANFDYIAREDSDIFVTGFRLGAKLIMEILDGSSELKVFSADESDKNDES